MFKHGTQHIVMETSEWKLQHVHGHEFANFKIYRSTIYLRQYRQVRHVTHILTLMRF
jgi:hypothetical protein